MSRQKNELSVVDSGRRRGVNVGKVGKVGKGPAGSKLLGVRDVAAGASRWARGS